MMNFSRVVELEHIWVTLWWYIVFSVRFEEKDQRLINDGNLKMGNKKDTIKKTLMS